MPLFEYECTICRDNEDNSLKQIEKNATKKAVTDLVKKYDNINNIVVVDLEKEKVRKAAAGKEKPDQLSVFREKGKTSKYLIVRIGYKILYSLTIMAGLFGAFMAWMAAMANA